PDDLAGFRIECIEVVARPGEEPLPAALVVLPVDQPALSPGATAMLGGRIPGPELPTCRGLERNNAARRGHGVEHASDDQVVRLILPFLARVVGPGDFQPGDIASIDLREWRIQTSPLAAQV